MNSVQPILEMNDVAISSRKAGGSTAHVVDQVSLSVMRGESLGIAGESGSGKSTLLLALMGMLRPGLHHSFGQVLFSGRPLLGQSDADLQDIRGGRIALIPQNASTAMTPTIRVGDQIDEALQLHTDLAAPDRRKRILVLLEQVRLPDPIRLSTRYPHELSGGQMQRVAIGMALAGSPEVLLLDEPTTGLDVTTQLAILELLVDLRRSSGVAMVCVSHDLGVLSMLCNRIGVMYAGSLVEEGPSNDLLNRPAHPYTHALLGSLPRITRSEIPASIPGAPPQPFEVLPGCRFAPRCSAAQSDCLEATPVLRAIAPGRQVACFHRLADRISKPSHPRPAGIAAGTEPSLVALDVKDLSVSYGKTSILSRLLGTGAGHTAVNTVTFSVRRGEVLGLVGESGSGKSTVLRAIAGIWPASVGVVSLVHSDAVPVALQPRLKDRSLAQLRLVQLVFQNPDASLNPRQRVADILAQPLLLYGKVNQANLRTEALRLLEDVRLGPAYLDRYPSQLSGGERQRVAIARAFAAGPDILLCDEITTALDVSVQAAVLGLVRGLAVTRKVATIFVSHDLGVVRAISDRVAVLYAGQLVEIGTADEICLHPCHPYTEALLEAVLEPGEEARGKTGTLPEKGAVASSGCAFAPRCRRRMSRCAAEAPDLYGDTHQSRCFLSEDSPKAEHQA